MSGTDAAATLTLRIDTGQAKADLELLKKEYGDLLAVMRAPATGKGVEGIGADAKLAAQQIDTLTKQVATLQAKMATAGASGSSGLLGNVTKAGYEVQGLFGQVDKSIERSNGNMKIMLRSAEMTGAASIKAAQVALAEQVRQGDQIVAAYARRNELIQALDLKRYEDAAAAEARLKSIQESRDKQTYDAEVAKYARRNELIQQLDVENYNARAASAARLKALQESRDKQMYDASVAAFEKQTALERRYILSSELSRAKAALDARKLMDGGYRGNLSAEFAPQTLLMASTTSAANLAANIKALGGAVAQSANNQSHWNTVANEGHAAARGLAGALGGLWLTYGSLAPLVATAALAGSLKGVFSVGKELEYEFTYIQAITNGVVVDLDKFGEAIKGSMATPVDAAKGLRTLAQAGLEVGEAITALPSVLKLATVGEVDLAGAALSATAIMHTFGMSVNDIGHIGDSLATAARLSATSVKEMMEAMKQASSVSNVFGVSLHETEAALATLANRGIEGSAAGTAIRNMVKELSSPATDKAAHALQQYGIQIFNADGSAKKFTANLQQLADVTSVMTKETKARFLEDMFNERGAKAANILLSDLEKMKTVLQEIEASSKGLGFMTEAQIRISQSTEGLIKTLKSNLAASLGEVFLEVKPQIDSVISSISTLVSSSSFKKAISSMAEAVADFTLILRDHADSIATVIAAYAGFKVLGILGAGVLAFEGALASLSVVAASSSTLLAALGGLLSGPVAIGLGVAAVAAGAYAIKQSGLDDTQKKVIQSARELTEAQGRLNQSLSDGLSALTKANDLQAERIRLLREGVSATDAAARANDNLGYSSAKANRDRLAGDLAAAKNHLNSPQFAGQDINFNPSPQFEAAFDAVRALEVEYKRAEQQLEESATKVIKAGMEGRRKELQDIQEKAYAEVEIQNKKFEAIARRASLAATELSEGKFYGKPETQEARKRTLQSDIDRGEAAKQFAPLDTRLAETEAVKVELARREAFLSENSLSYSRKESIAAAKKANAKTKAGGSNRGELKDERSILNAKMESALRQEKIQLGTRLIEIETQLADQTISATVATQRKNEATMASLEAEGLLLEKSMKAAQAVKDKVQIEKVQGQIDENKLKLLRQTEQATLDNTKANTANRNSIQDLTTISSRYIEDLQFEQIALDKTAQEVAQLRIEREQLRAVEDLQRRVDRNQVDPEVAKAERGAIDAKAAAQMQDQEFQRSYVAGWKKAHKAYVDDATNAAKQAADSYQAMSSAIEGALDEFLTTGKLNFAKFAQSVILDIAKIEAKALAARAMSSIGGGEGGFGGIVNGILGMFGGGGGGFSSGDFANLAASFIDSAKGNVFSGSPSLHAYANTVQTSPKTFAFQNLHGFAKGGIFAEAGPEAVMPLKRDSYGRLGVQAEGGDGKVINITVNINGNNNNPQDVRRAAGQGAREALALLNSARRYA